MRDYDQTTITLAEIIKRWREGDKKVLYWMVRDFPGLMVWMENDPIELLGAIFGHIKASTVNRNIRDWSGVAPEKPRGRPHGKRAKKVEPHMPPPLQNVPSEVVKDEALPVDQTGQQEESRQQVAEIPPAGGEPVQTVEDALRELQQEEDNG